MPSRPFRWLDDKSAKWSREGTVSSQMWTRDRNCFRVPPRLSIITSAACLRPNAAFRQRSATLKIPEWQMLSLDDLTEGLGVPCSGLKRSGT